MLLTIIDIYFTLLLLLSLLLSLFLLFNSMCVRLRLQRFGRTHSPFYRMVAADSRCPRDGKFLEIVGTYNPMPNRDGMKEIRIKTDRLKYWLSVGAQPSKRIAFLCGKFGILPPLPKPFSPNESIPKKDREGAKKK